MKGTKQAQKLSTIGVKAESRIAAGESWEQAVNQEEEAIALSTQGYMGSTSSASDLDDWLGRSEAD